MKKILFLDLEGTLIDVWHSTGLTTILTVPRLEEFIADEHFDEIGLFSFALWDEHDRSVFNGVIRPRIETLFNIRFTSSLILTVEDIWKRVSEVSPGVAFHNSMEFIRTHQKHSAFFDFSQIEQLHDHEITLVDDLVPNVHMNFDDRTVRMINVTKFL